MYSLSALTGHKPLSGSLVPTKLLSEAILIGEKAADPSAAALVFGTKALAGKRITDPSSWANSTQDKSRAWTSDLRRPLANKTRKKVLCVKSFIEMLCKGSNGSLVRQYNTKVMSQSGKAGATLGLWALNAAMRSETTLEFERSIPMDCDRIGASMDLYPSINVGTKEESQIDGRKTIKFGLEWKSTDQSTF